MRKLILLSALLALPVLASAADIYKCKGSKGEIIYQDVPCQNGAKPIAAGHYQQVPDDPRQAYAAAQEADRIHEKQGMYQATTQQPYQSISGEQRRRAASVVGSDSTSPTAGFQCSANGKTWIQATRCPETSKHTVTDSTFITGNVATTGEPISGFGTTTWQETVPVAQHALSKDDLCNQLSKNSRTAEEGRGSDSAYERNKMREASGCR